MARVTPSKAIETLRQLAPEQRIHDRVAHFEEMRTARAAASRRSTLPATARRLRRGA